MSTLLKDRLDAAAIARLARVFTAIEPDFAAATFSQQAQVGLAELELKERVRHVIAVLAQHLSTDFAKAAMVLQKVPEQWSVDSEQGDYGFAAWPIIDYVAVYGLAHPELSLQTLKILTPLFTAEFAIRPFLHQHFDLTYRYLQHWAQDDSAHVRRLASEGCRPRLPWGQRVPYLMSNPEPVIALLQWLKDDESEYVRRSVANSLNDISKDYPERVVSLVQQWLADQPTAQRQWIIKHATRGLVKSGHADALALLGYSQSIALANTQFTINQSQVTMDDSIQLQFAFSLSEAQRLVIDYALHLPRANGKKSLKVFKWKTGMFAAGSHQLSQDYAFKYLTTRRYYLGKHDFEVMVNGQSLGKTSVQLI